MAKNYRGACQKFCSAKCADSVRLKLLEGQKAPKGEKKKINTPKEEQATSQTCYSNMSARLDMKMKIELSYLT